MKLSLVLLLLGISLSQAFNPWGVFKKWKGEVEESLDSDENKKHAERFLKEVKDRKQELERVHEELGRDVMNKVHKVYKKVQDVEIIPTKPYEPEIKPTEPEILPTESEVLPTEPEILPTDFEEEGSEEPTEIPDEIEPTEESEIVDEPIDEYVEPSEESVVPYDIEVLSTPEAPEVPPTDEPEVEPTEQPTEDLELIQEPIEGNSSDEDEEEGITPKDSDDDDDFESEEQGPEEPEPVQEEVKPIVERLAESKDEFEVEDVDFAPKELWKELHEKSFGMKWLQKKQHKLRKLWKKFAEKHSEKIYKKIRHLEKKIAQRREE